MLTSKIKEFMWFLITIFAEIQSCISVAISLVSVYFGGTYPTIFEYSAMSISLYSFVNTIKYQIINGMKTLKVTQRLVGVNVGRTI